MSFNVLVTGCGGDIAQSIAKILKGYPSIKRVFGCDLHVDHAGIFIFDECLIVESASSPSYFESLARLVSDHKIDILIPSTEKELMVFLKLGIWSIKNCSVIRANDSVLEIALDKFTTASFLERNSIPVPKTYLLTDDFSPTFPCIVKGRMSSGSKSLFVVNDADGLSAVRKLVDNSIYQEYVGSEQDEYTCALFRSKKKALRHLTFKRRLGGGHSVFGEVVNNREIITVLEDVATATDLKGSINVQIRLTSSGPVIFEINPRFSSTVLVRHLLGFEDVIWSLQDTLDMPLSTYQSPAEGSRFFKGYQEFIMRSSK